MTVLGGILFTMFEYVDALCQKYTKTYKILIVTLHRSGLQIITRYSIEILKSFCLSYRMQLPLGLHEGIHGHCDLDLIVPNIQSYQKLNISFMKS